MKKFFVYASLLLIGGGFLFTGCEKTPVEPGPGTDDDFTFVETDLTQASFGVAITPKDKSMTYYYGLVSKSDYETNGGGEALQAANSELFEELAAANGVTLDELLVSELRSGEQTYETRLLTPGTEYVFYAYGLSTEGAVLTDVNTYEFSSPAAAFVSGVTFEITTPELTPTSFTLNVKPSSPDIFYVCNIMFPEEYEEYCQSSPENVGTYVKSFLELMKEDEYAAYTWPEFISASTYRGEITVGEDVFVNLLPETTYYAYAVGVANDGTIVTDATVQPITTSETPKNEYAVSNERVTDVSYSATVTATQSETFAVMMERQYYFGEDDTDAEIIQALVNAHGGDISEYTSADYDYVSFDRLIPNEPYWLFVFACNSDGTPKLDEGKVNLLKHPVKTDEAAMSDVNFDLWVNNIDRTTATVIISAEGSGAEEETYMFNYMTKEEYDDLEEDVNYWGYYADMDEALQSHMDKFLEARLTEYNDAHEVDMDMKEFLSRSLESGASTLIPVSYDLDGLESGESYVVYMFGMKADGSYTTSALTYEFTTVSDVQCAATIRFMQNTQYAALYGDKVYTAVYGYPDGNFDGYYMKFFPATDEWAGKTASEVLELLQKEQKFTRSGWNVANYVNLGDTWTCYAVCFDTSDVPTDVYKMTGTIDELKASSGDLTPEVLE